MNINWATLASVATAIGVSIAAWEIRQTWKLSQTEFEDSMDQQYRELSMGIPVDALIGKAVPKEEWHHVRELIYNYLDLSNEQVALRVKRRVRKDTWLDWCAGIKGHLMKPAFRAVWEEVKTEAPGTFSFLERLEREEFLSDPTRWS